MGNPRVTNEASMADSTAGEREYQAWCVFDEVGDMFSQDVSITRREALTVAVSSYNRRKSKRLAWSQLYARGYRCDRVTVKEYPAPAVTEPDGTPTPNADEHKGES